jgi:hypothetical protein
MGTMSAEYHREWARNNRARRKELNDAWREKQRQVFQSLKEGLICLECGEDRTPCLDIHHLDPSTKEIALGQVVNRGWSTERIKKEIEKCVVLCANCHRWEHHTQKLPR